LLFISNFRQFSLRRSNTYEVYVIFTRSIFQSLSLIRAFTSSTFHLAISVAVVLNKLAR